MLLALLGQCLASGTEDGFVSAWKKAWLGAYGAVVDSWDYKPTPYWGEFAKRALSGEKSEMQKMR